MGILVGELTLQKRATQQQATAAAGGQGRNTRKQDSKTARQTASRGVYTRGRGHDSREGASSYQQWESHRSDHAIHLHTGGADRSVVQRRAAFAPGSGAHSRLCRQGTAGGLQICATGRDPPESRGWMGIGVARLGGGNRTMVV